MKKVFSRAMRWFVLSVAPWTAVQLAAQETTVTIPELEQQVQRNLQERKPQIAIPLLRQIIKLSPNNLNAHANLGVLLFFQESYADAVPELRSAMELQPDLPKIEALLGIAEKRTGDPAAAQTNLEHAFPRLEEKEIQVQAGLELIEIDGSFGQLGKAAAVAETLESVSPQNPTILLAAYQISLQMTDRSLLSAAIAAPGTAELHMMMANQLSRRGDQANSIAQYQAAIRLNPKLPGVHFELAEQLRASSNPSLKAQAESEFKAALAINQFDAKAWRGLGEVLAEKGDLQAARQDYAKALSLQPADSDAETDMAIALESMKETDKAIPLLESAIKHDPTNLTAHFRLSTLYRQTGKITEGEREMDTFRHLKTMKDRLGTTLKEMQLGETAR